MYRFRIDYYRNNEFFQDYVWANTESDAVDFCVGFVGGDLKAIGSNVLLADAYF